MIGRTYEWRGLLLVPRATSTGRPDETISAEWFNDLPEDRKRQVLADGLGARLLEEGMGYVVPIFWLALDAEQTAELRNGSAFLVDCGQGTFAVTAAHVFVAYTEAKRTAAQIACQIGNLLFDPEAKLIDRDTSTDIATFRLSPEDVAKIDKPVLSSNEANWPPSPANEGDFAFFAGYPAQARGMAPGNYFAAVPYRAMTPITTITDYQITCRFNRDKMLDHSGQGLPPVGYDIGGMSGGPLLIPTLHARGIAWRLGGVVVEAAMGELVEKIVAVRPSYILPDGRLIRQTR
jgi:hypothetical protein